MTAGAYFNTDGGVRLTGRWPAPFLRRSAQLRALLHPIRLTLLACIATALLLGCTPTQTIRVAFADDPAARNSAHIASGLANDECERKYAARPFTPEIYQARLVGSEWHWGDLSDSVTASSYYASVVFSTTGSDTRVIVGYNGNRS